MTKLKILLYCIVCISDEVHCLETSSPPDKSYFATDVFVIFLVLSLLVAMVVILVLAVNKYSGKMRKHYSSSGQLASDMFCHSSDDQRDFSPSCPPGEGVGPPPLPPLPPPPPYSAHPQPPPSYSLLVSGSTS